MCRGRAFGALLFATLLAVASGTSDIPVFHHSDGREVVYPVSPVTIVNDINGATATATGAIATATATAPRSLTARLPPPRPPSSSDRHQRRISSFFFTSSAPPDVTADARANTDGNGNGNGNAANADTVTVIDTDTDTVMADVTITNFHGTATGDAGGDTNDTGNSGGGHGNSHRASSAPVNSHVNMSYLFHPTKSRRKRKRAGGTSGNNTSNGTGGPSKRPRGRPRKDGRETEQYVKLTYMVSSGDYVCVQLTPAWRPITPEANKNNTTEDRQKKSTTEDRQKNEKEVDPDWEPVVALEKPITVKLSFPEGMSLSEAQKWKRNLVTVKLTRARRQWTMVEKKFVYSWWKRHAKDAKATVSFLQIHFPDIFGKQHPVAPLQETNIYKFAEILESNTGAEGTGSGRKKTLPPHVEEAIISACTSVLSSKACLFKSRLLRAIAVGVIKAHGYSEVISQQKGHGFFKAGVEYVRTLMKSAGFRWRKPFKDTRKLPQNALQMVRTMALRIAYFVKVYDIPKELVQNWDQSGIMWVQRKGGGWFTGESISTGQIGAQNEGDKRQFTVTFGNTACGRFLKPQLIFAGKTVSSLPQFPDTKYIPCDIPVGENHVPRGWKLISNGTKEGDEMMEKLQGIGHLAVTYNHWSNQWTSIDLLVNVIVPDYMETKRRLNLGVNHAAVLLLDCWWGWLDRTFVDYVKKNYPWIKLVYVPPNCTPIGQPQDGGTISKVKSVLRNLSDQKIMQQVSKWILDGNEPSDFKLDMSAQKVKQELTHFLSSSQSEVSKELVLKTWEKTGCLDAWDPQFQREAVQKSHSLFPNLDNLGSLEEDELFYEDSASSTEISPESNHEEESPASHEAELQTETEEWDELMALLHESPDTSTDRGAQEMAQGAEPDKP